MSGWLASNDDHLIRSNLWSAELKELQEAALMGTRYVRFITDFPDGDTLNIPSIGQAEVLDYTEGQAIQYTAMDTGNFTFSIDQYKSSATYITNKMKQDAYYTNQLVASFVPKQHRALMVAMENKIMAVGPDGQTASNRNQINSADHRWIGSGTSETIALKDFQLARFALEKASAPLSNLVAIIDPSVEYALQNQSNVSNILTPQPKWANIVHTGITDATGMNFAFNLYGFDVYVSQFLKSAIAETISAAGGSRTSTVGVANLFFSASPGDTLPIVGLIRQPPRVDSEYNKDYQREEYVTTCRYGFKLYRPENLCVVITDTDQVS